jgi:hypothetical protein
LLTGAQLAFLPGTVAARRAADVLHFGRSAHFLVTDKPNTEPPHRSLSESDYAPPYEAAAVVISRPEVALRQKVLGKPKKIYLLPRSYLVKEDLTSAYVLHICNGIAGGLASTNLLLNSSCSFPSLPQGIQLTSFETEVLWLRERRSGAHGLQARFAS